MKNSGRDNRGRLHGGVRVARRERQHSRSRDRQVVAQLLFLYFWALFFVATFMLARLPKFLFLIHLLEKKSFGGCP